MSITTLTTEPCIIPDCGANVDITIALNGGLAVVDAHGYCGTTDDGDAVCRDHFCPLCGGAHTGAEEFDLCAFYGGAPVLTGCGDAVLAALYTKDQR